MRHVLFSCVFFRPLRCFSVIFKKSLFEDTKNGLQIGQQKNNSKKCTLEYSSEHFFGQTMGGPLLSSIFVKQATACHYPCNFVQVLSIDPCKWRKKYTSGARNSTTKHCKKHGLVPSNNKTTAKYTIWCQAVAESARGVNKFVKKQKKHRCMD